MNLNEYQEAAWATAQYPDKGECSIFSLSYATLKGAGEAGEFAEKVGKAIRDEQFGQTQTNLGFFTTIAKWLGFSGGDTRYASQVKLSNARRDELVKELGDEMWYCAAKATELGVTLEEVCQTNIEKLASRQERGVIKGSGDER